MSYIWIFIGGGMGSIARYAASGFVARFIGETFPWGTLFVNVTGSFVVGFIATLTDTEGRFLASPGVRQFLLLGICGGYTTFSSFSLQTLELVRDGEWLRAGGNAALSFLLCMTAVWLGHVLATAINSTRGI